MVIHPYIMYGIAVVLTIGLVAAYGQPLAEQGIAELFKPLGSFAASFTTGGMTITSIDAVNVKINNRPNPNGYFRITAVVDRGSESAYGTIVPSRFEQESGTETLKSFTISIQDVKEKANYQVDNYRPNTGYYLVRYFGDCSGADWDCTLSHLCVKKVYNTIIADINHPSDTVEVKVAPSIQGMSAETATVSNLQPTASFSFGSIKFVGNLFTGNYAPNEGDFKAIYHKDQSNWKIIRRSDYDYNNYLNQQPVIESYLNQKCSELFADTNVIQNKVSNFNVVYDAFKAKDEAISQGFDWVQGRNSESGQVDLEYELIQRSFNPELVFTVDADDIGIKVDVGQPQIDSVSSPDFSSGDLQGRIDIQARNIGDGAGSFAFSLESCNNFAQSYSITGEQIAAGQSKLVIMPVRSRGAAVETFENCIVKMCETSSFSASGGFASACDTKQVQLHMTEARFCTEGQTILEGRCIKECKNNQYVEIECCSDDQVIGTNALTGDYKCQAGTNNGGGGGFDIVGFLTDAAGYLLVAGIIALIIAGLLVLLPILIPGAAVLVGIGAFVRSKFVWVVLGIMVVLIILLVTVTVPVGSLFRTTATLLKIPL